MQHHGYALRDVLLSTYPPLSEFHCCISRGKMWIHAGWLQILQFCFFTALMVSHIGSLGGGNSSDSPAQPKSALGSSYGASYTTRQASCPTQRASPATSEWEVDFHREKITVSPDASHSLTLVSFLITTLPFKTSNFQHSSLQHISLFQT